MPIRCFIFHIKGVQFWIYFLININKVYKIEQVKITFERIRRVFSFTGRLPVQMINNINNIMTRKHYF